MSLRFRPFRDPSERQSSELDRSPLQQQGTCRQPRAQAPLSRPPTQGGTRITIAPGARYRGPPRSALRRTPRHVRSANAEAVPRRPTRNAVCRALYHFTDACRLFVLVMGIRSGGSENVGSHRPGRRELGEGTPQIQTEGPALRPVFGAEKAAVLREAQRSAQAEAGSRDSAGAEAPAARRTPTPLKAAGFPPTS